MPLETIFKLITIFTISSVNECSEAAFHCNHSNVRYNLSLSTHLCELFSLHSWLQYSSHLHQQHRPCTPVHTADQVSGRWCCWCCKTTGGPVHFLPPQCRTSSPVRSPMTQKCCLIYRRSLPSAWWEDRELEE